jgi:hypothetical protein
MSPSGGANNRLFSSAENIGFLHSCVCRNLMFLAQVRAASRDRWRGDSRVRRPTIPLEVLLIPLLFYSLIRS